MKQFEYQAQRNGKSIADRLTAASLQAAREQLESQGFELLSITEVPARSTPSAAAADQRLPLRVVLDTLADDIADRRLSQAVEQLTVRLDDGATLDEAMDSMSGATPRYLNGILRAATTSGDVAEVCDSFIRLRQITDESWLAVRRLMLYPTVLLLVLVGLGFLTAYMLIPPFADIYEEFDLEVPFTTSGVVQAGPYLPWLLLALLGAWIAVMLLPRLLGIGFPVRTAMPMIGRVFSSVSHEQFAQMLASFLRMRIPLPTALTYTGDLLEDRSLARATYRASKVVEQGASLAGAMAEAHQFDRSLAVMVQWGEQRSNLAESLSLAAEMFVTRRLQRMQLLSRIVPPITLVCVAGSAIVIATALYSPLSNLLGWLRY